MKSRTRGGLRVKPRELHRAIIRAHRTHEAQQIGFAEKNGSPGRIRTSDQPVNSRLLYR